jgi:hypothetical protein
LFAASKCPNIGDVLPTGGDKTRAEHLIQEQLAWSESKTSNELQALIGYCRDSGWFSSASNLVLTIDGWKKLETLRHESKDSSQGFVAMWFDSSMTSIYQNGFKPGIEDSGFNAFRIDQKEHANMIDDEIVAEIRRSRFLVCDFTCAVIEQGDRKELAHRGGVYFEAGFALGLGLPVIWTCRHDLLSGIHFDVRQYNTIAWERAEELRERLKNRIVAILGQGPNA